MMRAQITMWTPMMKKRSKLVGLPGNKKYEKSRMTDEELQREYDYYMAEKIAKKMCDSGIISIKEYTKIREENRRFFSPFLAEIS